MKETFAKWFIENGMKYGLLNETILRIGFNAGYKAALKERETCPKCGKDNELHPSMLNCHGCRVKFY